jgi:hypothetical protein
MFPDDHGLGIAPKGTVVIPVTAHENGRIPADPHSHDMTIPPQPHDKKRNMADEVIRQIGQKFGRHLLFTSL